MIKVNTYDDALDVLETFGAKEVTTKRQMKNGTRVFELPITKWFGGRSYATRLAVYSSGYIRNVSDHLHSAYQLNPKYTSSEVRWNKWHKKLVKYTSTKRALIPDEEARMIFLAKFILNNYASRKNTYEIYPHTKEWIDKQIELANTHYHEAINDVSLSINGTRYKVL